MSCREPDPDLLAWIVLRRVQGGGVARAGERWLQDGRPVPGYLTAVLDTLIAAGLVALVGPDPSAEVAQQVRLTGTGQVRYVALCAQRERFDTERSG